MVLTPFSIILSACLGLLALVGFGVGLALLRRANRRPVAVVDRATGARVGVERFGGRNAVLLAIALALMVLPLFGRHVVSLLRPTSGDVPPMEAGGSARRVKGASGADLAVEEMGPEGAPRLVFTHGWGADRREWHWAREKLSRQFRVVTWDLPGLGQSTEIPNGDYALEKLAGDLQTVVRETGSGPAVLVGHSIGGMINLTVCRLGGGHPPAGVVGIVQLNTTYTNPVKTVKGHETAEALQKPVFEPLLHLFIGVSPLIRVLNWFSYQSGLAHLQNASSSFAGTETWEELDFASRYVYQSSPAVVARGTLGMLHWDASDVLPRVAVPVLIVSGAQDTTTLPSASERMKAEIPGSAHVQVNPAAHLGPIEQHERYNQAIAEFAGRLGR